jgi:Ca-activated chloride channel homolog
MSNDGPGAMSREQNPYDILGVPNTATIEEIKAVYRRIARRLHPDVNPNHPAASAQFQDIVKAYELLIDSGRRQAIDQQLNQSEDGFVFSLQVTPSKRVVMPLPEPQVIYLLADILPDSRAQEVVNQREARLNLALVLDHSNSMRGTRIEKVKIAAHQIIDNLGSDDILSIVIFNDRAETIIPATPIKDRPALKAKVSMISPGGGTEIFQGLAAGVRENREYLSPNMVNHVILLTDGHTFGDQDKCIDLASQAARDGIGISAMGLGHDWNDQFLDELATKTGGSSEYITSAGRVVRFLNDHVRNLSSAFAERLRLSIAPDSDIVLESAFKLAPHPQPMDIENGELLLGGLQLNRHISVLLQIQMPNDMKEGPRGVARLVASGDIFINRHQQHLSVCDISLDVSTKAETESPPDSILDALSKLTLYRLQERAQQALEHGDVTEATRRLENLATRLLAMGQDDLAGQALSEARRVAHTKELSDKGRKTLKYQTRHLLLGTNDEDLGQ